MRRHSPIESPSGESSFGESDYTRSNAGDSVESDTDLTDVDAVFRLVYKRATSVKLDGAMNQSMHKVLSKLAKKHGLKKIGRDKACMYVEDLSKVLHTNLVTTEKRYPHGRYRMQAYLYLLLAGFTANRPQAILGLCYRHLKVTLLRDPEDMNTFPVPEIIFEETLLLSAQVVLLGMLFYDRAFAAYYLASKEELTRLTILPGRNELPLHLSQKLDDIPVLRKAVRTVHGWDISPNEPPPPYSTLLPWIRTLGEIIRFAQVTRPYSLRYAAGKAFNENGNVSDAMQNLMIGHASIKTFEKHYLSRRITVDTQAVVRGIQPQTVIIRAACTISRSIDNRRLSQLTGVKKRWELEQPVHDVERQLAGGETKTNPKLVHDAMPPAHRELADLILSELGSTIEEEMARRNRAIRAVTLYCGIEEGGMNPTRRGGRSRNAGPPAKSKLEYEEEALEAAKVSVYKEERPKVCFLCLGKEELPLATRIHPFSTSGDLSKHFKRKHLKHIGGVEGLRCKLCNVPLENKMHLQRHAFDVHGTVS
ncbi:hypothetical protein CC80DRAFT_520408 [Byssothecium circinans]|uniref:C2H2-type domain-containing protein n=1 Tax=Byssothecium circinans TaxID=147558 RepID=A0A6A5TBJ1_9PLEO|nr:hypothetical protein CC80DRAFT_520408 [Byssothecium circinans]